MTDIKLGSHVGMSGKDMFLNSVNEALSYGANTFMVYTGAPQNTRRKDVSALNIPAALAAMQAGGNRRVCGTCALYHQPCQHDKTGNL